MPVHPPKENAPAAGPSVTVTRRMMRERAIELALLSGRSAQEASKADWEQARRELNRGPDADSPRALLE